MINLNASKIKQKFLDLFSFAGMTAKTFKSASLYGILFLSTSVMLACGGGGGALHFDDQFSVGGTVTGLGNQQVTLLNSNGDRIFLNGDGNFTFDKKLPYNGQYSVTVETQPSVGTCTVSDGSGSGIVANISNIAVICSTITHTVSGMVIGLNSGEQVTIRLNGADPTVIAMGNNNSNPGAPPPLLFTFSTAISHNGSYSVTVDTQPIGKTCTVNNGSGAGMVADVSNVSVFCNTNTYTVGGTVTGLAAGQQVTLRNNGADAKTVIADGGFTFAIPVAYNGSYSVTVGTQPTGQTCTVSAGSGAGMVANISNVNVICTTNTYFVGGMALGLTSGQQVTLLNNGADPIIVTPSTTSFIFPTRLAYNSSYNVTIGTQPTGQTCTVNNGSGAGIVANIGNVSLVCTTNTYTVGGTVTGLSAGQQVTLLNNGADPSIVTANGNFTFSTRLAYNTSYIVTVGTQPTGQTCTVSSGSGAGIVSNVNNVSVDCQYNSYSVSGVTSGLFSGQQVTLLNNGADPKTVTDNGVFTFGTPLAYNSSYLVSIGTQPTMQSCMLRNNAGNSVSANITNIALTCSGYQFAYTSNVVTGNITGFSVNPATGALTSIPGSPFAAAGSSPYFISASPTGNFIYSVSDSGNNISVFRVNATTGALTAVSGSPFATGTTPYGVTVNPAGTFAYVTNAGSNNVSVYSINPTTGALTPIAGSPFAAGTFPNAIQFSPNGAFAYVTNQYTTSPSSHGEVSVFSVNATTGALTPIAGSPFAAGAQPFALALNPAGTLLYVANSTSSNVSAYRINTTTGALTEVSGSPFASGFLSFGIAVNPAGTSLYVSNSADNNISVFSINSTSGVLTAVPGSPFAAGTQPQTVSFNPTGTIAYVPNMGSDSISVYTVNTSTGALTPAAGSPYSTGTGTYPTYMTFMLTTP